MSLQAMSWAREVMPSLPEAIKTGPRLLLMLMADYVNERAVCWPSVRRLAGEMGCSMRTVQRALDVLVEHKLILVECRKRADGRQTSNGYRLLMRRDFKAAGPLQQDKPCDEENGDQEASKQALPATEAAELPRSEHAMFSNTVLQADSGQRRVTSGARQVPMTLDWQPHATHWQSETLRRGDPSLTWDQGELADFTAHFADQRGRAYSNHAWCAKFVRWVSENRKREAARQARMSQNTNTPSNNNARNTGGTHGSRRSTGPIRNSKLSAAEGRALIEQRRRKQAEGQPPSGDIIDGEWL